MKRLAALLVCVALVGVTTSCRPAEDELWQFHDLSVKGTYTPLLGDFNGDGTTDVFWYGLGGRPDSLWLSRPGQRGLAGFERRAINVWGTFRPVVADIIGDERDEILWFTPSVGYATLVWNIEDSALGYSSSYIENTRIGALPVRLEDRRGPGFKDDLFYAGNDGMIERYADDGSGEVTLVPARTAGGYTQMVIGDWNGDGLDDVLWYRAGSGADYRWDLFDDGTIRSSRVTVNGTFRARVLRRDGGDAILWWATGPDKDAAWIGGGTQFRSIPIPQTDLYGLPFATGADGIVITVAGRDVLFVIDEADRGDFYWLAHPAVAKSWDQVPYPGDFDGDGQLDLLWYGEGDIADDLWYLKAAPGDRSLGARTAQAEPR